MPTARVTLCIQPAGQPGGPEWEPETLPVHLRPGAPQALRLLPGHPWEPEGGAGAEQGAEGAGEAPLAPLRLQAGEALPAFQVGVVGLGLQQACGVAGAAAGGGGSCRACCTPGFVGASAAL